MVNPPVCWVANTRTIWTHLVIKHADSIAKADEELKLYREADVTSEIESLGCNNKVEYLPVPPTIGKRRKAA